MTFHDTNLLRHSAGLLPQVAGEEYVRAHDIHTALYLAGTVLAPDADRAQLLRAADHVMAMYAKYLITYWNVPAGATIKATLRAWVLTARLRPVIATLHAAARHYQLWTVLTEHGPDGLRLFLQTGEWPATTTGWQRSEGLENGPR